jgi:hypothetical protein
MHRSAWRCWILGLLVVLALPRVPLLGQSQDSALSDVEIDKLRDSAPLYAERVLLFSSFLDDRAKEILTLNNGRRKPGREQDLHDLMEQFSSIANDLEDNLADYGPRHRDLRKALPKLLAATERWQSALKTPPDNEAYDVSRKLALEAVSDLQEDVTKLIPEQKDWFQAHPPTKEDERAKNPGR